MLSARRGGGGVPTALPAEGWGTRTPSQHEDDVPVPLFSVFGSIVLGLQNVVGRQKPTPCWEQGGLALVHTVTLQLLPLTWCLED